MAYRFNGSTSNARFASTPLVGTLGAQTIAVLLKRNAGAGTTKEIVTITNNALSALVYDLDLGTDTPELYTNGGVAVSANGTTLVSGTTLWYLLAVTWSGSGVPRFHLYNGTAWTHSNGTGSAANTTIGATDRIYAGGPPGFGSPMPVDIVCAGIKKANTADLAVEALTETGFASWAAFGFDWLIGCDTSLESGGLMQDQSAAGTGDEVSRTALTLVADPPGWTWALTPPTTYAWDFGDSGTSTATSPSHTYTNPGVYTVSLTATNAAGSNTKTRTAYVTVNSAFVPQIIWFTPAPLTGAPAAPTFESATAYSTVANRPAVTGTTRPFASSAALTGALNAAGPGDLVQYTGAGVLDIAGNYTGFSGRRYAGYVNVDLGLPGSANHVRFTGGGGAGLPAVAIYNSAFLRIYGGEITNPLPKATGYDGLHVYGAQSPGNGSTNHITWWNLLVHDTVDSGIKMLPNVVSGGGNAADNTIADCDIEAEVHRIGLDKTVDTSHAERGTGQHCCLLADTDPAGATYPSFLRNRVAIDGHDTGLTSSQGGGSVIELGFNDAASTISGCTLILRGANTMFNAQQQTGGNGLNLWGDAQAGVAIPFLQHSNATGSAVCNPGGQNRPGVVVAYGRHANTNQNAYEGTSPWQIGPTYTNVA